MTDPIYAIPENPIYNSEIRALQDSDPARASTVFNPVLEKMITNMHAVKLVGDELSKSVKALEDAPSAVPTTRRVNNKALSADITLTAADVGAVPTTRRVNNKALSADIALTAADVGAVPTTRMVNGRALSANISLAAADVGAVPTTRTVNGRALSANISLTAADVSASPSSHTHTAAAVGAAASSHIHAAKVVDVTLSTSGWSSSTPYTQTVNVSYVTSTSVNDITPSLSITAAQLTALQAANIQDGGQSTGSITLKAFGTKPAVSIPIRVIITGV